MKTTNEKVALCFINKEEARGSNFYSYGRTINSYTTPIAVWGRGVIYLNATKYSHTTSKQMWHIKLAARKAGIRTRELSWRQFEKKVWNH